MGQLGLFEISLRLPYLYLCPKNGLFHLYKGYFKDLRRIYYYLFDKTAFKIDFFSLINY